MNDHFMTLNSENIESEHLCCIIRSKKPHPGVEAKREWLRQRLPEGHCFRKLDAKGCCFAEYAPLEKAWVPVVGENWLYLYCLWVSGDFKGKGYGKQLMESVIQDAKALGKSGICMLSCRKPKNWLSSGSFAEKYGFTEVDTTEDGYTLLALPFDGSRPSFADSVQQEIPEQELTVYYSFQCPFVLGRIGEIQNFCREKEIHLNLRPVDSLEKAKSLPCVFNNFGIFYRGKFQTVNLLDVGSIEKLIKRCEK